MKELHKIAEGREAEIFAWGDGAVLRLMRSPDAQRAVEWQAQAVEAARASGVRVPAVHGVMTAQGRPGLIMERVEGQDYLTLLGRRPWLVLEAARTLGEVHAQLHAVAAPDTLRPLKATVQELLQGTDRVPDHLKPFALAALEALPEGDAICHGDYHPANLIVTEGHVTVIDWTNATRGHPDADVARTLLLLRLGEPPPGTPLVARVLALVGRRIVRWGYLRAYRRLRPLDMGAVARWEAPNVAVRLTEEIESERARLLRILEEGRREVG